MTYNIEIWEQGGTLYYLYRVAYPQAEDLPRPSNAAIEAFLETDKRFITKFSNYWDEQHIDWSKWKDKYFYAAKKVIGGKL